MATQLFLQDALETDHCIREATRNDPQDRLSLSRGGASHVFQTATVAGPTSGVPIQQSGNPTYFISAPLAAGVTISGTITLNLWMSENNMSANVGAECRIYRIDSQQQITEILRSEKGTELPVTTPAAQNWTATPTSTAFSKGDRIAVSVYGNDGGGTMASGFTMNVKVNGPTAGADGDSYVSFTETFSFETTPPGGSVLYLTDTASDVNIDASTDEREAWTTRGGGVVQKLTRTPAGWTSGVRMTNGDGGNVIEWYTKPLQAFTLGDIVTGNLRTLTSGSLGTTVGLEIAVVNGDGSSPTVWASGIVTGNLNASETVKAPTLTGADLAVSNGQRLRLRVYWDDSPSDGPMVVDTFPEAFYNGTSGGASGDAFITLSQSVAEFTGAAEEPVFPWAGGGYYP